LRVGVGRPEDGDVTSFLLSPLAEPAARALATSLDDARLAIDLWVRLGLEPAMNRVNRKSAAAGSTAD
jgi:peptidyl-tRNA hydrolase